MSTTIVPIIIPVHHEEAKCPECGKPEDKKTVCGHCGHEYNEEETGCLAGLVGVAVIVTSIWLLITVVWWIADSADGCGSEPATLLGLVKSQWEFVRALRVW